MITAERKGENALVRFHDEFYDGEPDACLKQAGGLVCEAYRRRAVARRNP